MWLNMIEWTKRPPNTVWTERNGVYYAAHACVFCFALPLALCLSDCVYEREHKIFSWIPCSKRKREWKTFFSYKFTLTKRLDIIKCLLFGAYRSTKLSIQLIQNKTKQNCFFRSSFFVLPLNFRFSTLLFCVWILISFSFFIKKIFGLFFRCVRLLIISV